MTSQQQTQSTQGIKSHNLCINSILRRHRKPLRKTERDENKCLNLQYTRENHRVTYAEESYEYLPRVARQRDGVRESRERDLPSREREVCKLVREQD